MRTLPSIVLYGFWFAALTSLMTGCSKPADKTEYPRPVRAITLVAAPQEITAEYSGNVHARVESKLGFRVGGKIAKRLVDVGTLVKPGQVLMQLDPQDLQLAQSQSLAALKSARSNFQLAEFELKRFQELYKTHAVSQSALDAKTTAFDAAKSALEQAEAGAKSQANQTAYANLVADVEGVVTDITAEVGQVVSAGMPVVHLAKAGELEVVVGIPENNLDIIRRATQIDIHLWANSKEVIHGKIREVSPLADAATRTFTAKVSLIDLTPKQVALVKLGMTASVQFAVTTSNEFVKVPLTAMFQDRGVTSVWIVEKGAVKLVPVQVGGVSGNDMILTSGVNAGQTVVTAGVHVLNPGQQVTVMPPEEKPAAPEPFITPQSLMVPPSAQGAKK